MLVCRQCAVRLKGPRRKRLLILFQFPEFPSKTSTKLSTTSVLVLDALYVFLCATGFRVNIPARFDHFHYIHYSSFIIYGRACQCVVFRLRRFVEISFMSSTFGESSHKQISVKAQTGTCDFQQFSQCRHRLSQWHSRKWAIICSVLHYWYYPINQIKYTLQPYSLFEEHKCKTSPASLHCIQAVQSRSFCSSQMICWI